jgi:hypothetical protein
MKVEMEEKEIKGRTREEVDTVIRRITAYERT